MKVLLATIALLCALLRRTVEIFNTTTGSIVEVPDEAVDAYLAQPAYRKVKPADRSAQTGPTTLPPDGMISQADFDAALAAAAADKQAAVDAAIAETQARADADKEAAIAAAVADARAQAAPAPAQDPPL